MSRSLKNFNVFFADAFSVAGTANRREFRVGDVDVATPPR
jgi:hypothetical protein